MNNLSLSIPGIASGFDWKSYINQVANTARTPEVAMQSEQTVLQEKSAAFASISQQLATLQAKATALSDPQLFNQRSAQVDSNVATAIATTGATVGSHTLNVQQVATNSSLTSAPNIAQALNPANSSTLTFNNASFSQPVTAGTFTVDGQQITLDPNASIQQTLTSIGVATFGSVSATYDPTQDKITLSSSSPIILGTAADTSNFLQVAKLYNNGTATISSSSTLGSIRASDTLASANFSSSINNGTSASGQFLVNGVAINFDAATDTPNTVINSINSSSAGVTASFNSQTNQLQLTNTTTGSTDIAVQDVQGNFIAATGLATGQLTQGKDLTYTLDGNTGTSNSNTITDVPNLAITVANTGTANITVANDPTAATAAITGFLAEYNNTQGLISARTATDITSPNSVTPGLLAGDTDIARLTSDLRNIASSVNTPRTGTVQNLFSLGISSNGQNNLFTLSDPSQLAVALTSNPTGVQALFTDPTTGIASQMATYTQNATGTNGILPLKRADANTEYNDLGQMVNRQEAIVQNTTDNLQSQFVKMEQSLASMNQQQQLIYLQFGTPPNANPPSFQAFA